ncbi:FAD-binding protein [Cellulosilyticum sp. I15G10I2]|uniref:FAD-binding protein n=1 Tax=Cellulosilyticum sp. I15G10I2 TaxID=1892843 RepID=UPI00085C8589|nr:FAD-binding protein [Cellulosilyticum sp. I15G10I2]
MEIITSHSNHYNEARQIWNRAIQKYPMIIAYCKTVEDVRNAILEARRCNLENRVRSGGHNYEGYCIATDAYIIDIGSLNLADALCLKTTALRNY